MRFVENWRSLMKARIPAILISGILLAFSIACSKGHDGAPTSPLVGNGNLQTGRDQSNIKNDRLLLGYWNVAINTQTGKVEFVPVRQVAFHLNVVGVLNASIQNVYAGGVLSGGDEQMQGNVRLDITLTHPINDAQYDGYDVRGIVIGNMSVKDDPDLLDSKFDPGATWVGPNGLRLANADGWTRWWNPTEYTPGTLPYFAYVPGLLATKGFNGPATLNPYKYFADSLTQTTDVSAGVTATTHGKFSHGMSNVRRYELLFPIVGAAPEIKFDYAVDASWQQNGSPPDTNCPEAFNVKVDSTKSTAYYVAPGVSGGDLLLDVTVFDWQAAGNIDSQISKIVVESPAMMSNCVQFTAPVADPATKTSISGTYHLVVNNVTPTALDNQEILVTVVSTTSDPHYVDKYGVGLAAYTLVPVTIRPITATMPTSSGVLPAGNYTGLDAQNYICYILESSTGMYLVNTTDMSHPTILKTVSNLTGGVAVKSAGKYAYVADTNPTNAFNVVLVDPYSSAAVKQTLSLSYVPTSISLQGNYAYVGGSSKVTIVNITTPESSAIVGSPFTTMKTGTVTDLKAVGSYLYVVDDWLEIWDISNPTSPTFKGAYSIGGPTSSKRLDVNSKYAFVTDSAKHIQTIDISNPASPALYATYTDADNNVNDLQAVGNMIFSVVKSYGVKVIDFNDSTKAFSVISSQVTTSYANICVVAPRIYIDDDFVICSAWSVPSPPTQGWANTWGGTAADDAADVAIDSLGNYYVTGTFKGTVDFDPGPGVNNLTSGGYNDCFLSKFGPDGTFQWTETWGGTDGDSAPSGVEVDNLGDVWVAGTFKSSTLTFPGGTNQVHSYVGTGTENCFIVKFTNDGTVQYVNGWGAFTDTYVYKPKADLAGNVYVCGSFSSYTMFPGGSMLFPTGVMDCYLMKLDPTLDGLWVHSWGASSNIAVGQSVGVDASGNPFVAGVFTGTCDFDPSSGLDNHTSNGSDDAFLIKFDSVGTYQWGQSWGGPDDDMSMACTVDNVGDIYVGGFFNGSVDFDPGPGTDIHNSSSSEADAFLTKFGTDGTYKWARTWGGSYADATLAIAVDGSNYVYATGYDSDSTGTLYNCFLNKYDSSGNSQWTQAWGDPAHNDYTLGIAIDDGLNSYICGAYDGTCNFAPGSTLDYRTSNGDLDCFLVKFRPNGYW